HPGIRLRLGQLVLVVWKLQVQAAAVDVERLAEEAHAHGDALDVPTGAARPPGTVPLRLARFGSFPEGKIARVALLGADLDARARLELFGIAVAELAVIRVARHVEIDVA